MSPDEAAVVALTALSTIATLVVMSAGLAVIFGTMRVINIAHGEFLMLGAYTALQAVHWGVDFWLTLLIAPLVVGAIGLVIERALIRFLYGRLLETILATWGLSLIIVQVMLNIYGGVSKGIPPPLGSLRIGDFSISQYSLVMMGFALALLTVIYWVFTHTRYGVMARAASQVPEVATALGVNTDRINMLTFAFGSAVTGAAGAMLAPLVSVVPSMGGQFIAQAFMTVVVGGSLVVSGTLASGALLGATNSLVSYFVTTFVGQAVLLSLAVVVLRLRPEGISSGWRRSL